MVLNNYSDIFTTVGENRFVSIDTDNNSTGTDIIDAEDHNSEWFHSFD